MATDGGSTNVPGGTVEPANRATVAKQAFQTSQDPPAGRRYELRDPFAEVTYRTTDFDEMAAKADQLRATRFTALEPDGSKVTVTKAEGQWNRPEQRTAQTTARDLPNDARKDKIAPVAKTPVVAETTLAKIDIEAERAARVTRLEAALFERYVIKRSPVKVGDVTIGQTEYRYRGETGRIAFTESTFRLSTDNNNPSVARSMVDVAETRNWRALRVSGNEDFKRMVWLEASLRGVRTLGYEPQLADQELLRREREARAVNRIEPDRQAAGPSATSDAKQSARGGGRKAVLAALEAVLVAKGVPQKQREAVMSAAAENLAQRLRQGQTLKVKVLDKAAPSQRVAPAPVQTRQQVHERPAPTR